MRTTRGKGVAGRRWARLAGSCERLERGAGQMGWGAMDARTVASRAWRKVFVLEVAGALDKVEAEGRGQVVVAEGSGCGREVGRLESAAGELHTAWDEAEGGRDDAHG